MPAPEAAQGGRWRRLSAYAAGLTADDFTLLDWPRPRPRDLAGDPDAPRPVSSQGVQTRGRELDRRPLVRARPSLEAPASAPRDGASSELDAEAAARLGHIAARWDVAAFVSDTEDVLGLGQDQPMTATAIVRCGALVRAAYCLHPDRGGAGAPGPGAGASRH